MGICWLVSSSRVTWNIIVNMLHTRMHAADTWEEYKLVTVIFFFFLSFRPCDSFSLFHSRPKSDWNDGTRSRAPFLITLAGRDEKTMTM